MTGAGARLVRSLVYGTLVQAFMLYLVFLTGGGPAAQWLLWNGTLVGGLTDRLTGPMPVVGHAAGGLAIVEPGEFDVLLAAAVASLVFGIVVYSAAVHAVLPAFARRRTRMHG